MLFSFFNKYKKDNDYYLGIFLKETKGVIIIIKKEKNNVFIEDKINFDYSNGWENLTEDIDEIIYQIEEKNKTTISKTIFFVYSHLIDDINKNIKNPYLNKIKKIIKDLNLDVLGYIECFEAIFLSIEEKEKSVFNGILLETDENQITIFVYQNGKLFYKKTVGKTDNIVDDFIFSLSDLKDKNILLPSRIIIYDFDFNVEKFINYQWKENYFIEKPKIEFLNEEKLLENLVGIFSKQIIKKEEKNNNLKEENFGFVFNQDIENNNKFFNLNKINYKIINFFSFLKFFKLNFLNYNFLFLLGFVFIFLIFFVNEYFFHKTILTIYLPSKLINKKINKEIDYKIATLSANFSETISTTGKKEIGEKASGTVIFHNFDDKEIILNKGALLEASGIKFLLEEDIKVSSSTITPDASAKLPGKKEAKIIAQNIGSEGNLSKGTRFKINNLSENLYFAINEKSLTGGTKKEIRTVSLKDMNNLENKILEKSKKYNFNIKISKDEKILKDLTEYKIFNKKFSKELGEESNSLNLDAEVNVVYYIYSEKKLKNDLFNELRKDLDNNFVLLKEKINFEFEKITKNKNNLNIFLNINGKAIKKIDEKKVIFLIKGKNKKNIEKILRSNFDINHYDLTIKNNIYFLNNFISFFEKNIKIITLSL
ncbi:MAG: hypothetical protein N2593_01090 [Patescibacteria group bacterium]|nr:hypothetical protein [Patescibacteria group bacterium]